MVRVSLIYTRDGIFGRLYYVLEIFFLVVVYVVLDSLVILFLVLEARNKVTLHIRFTAILEVVF